MICWRDFCMFYCLFVFFVSGVSMGIRWYAQKISMWCRLWDSLLGCLMASPAGFRKSIPTGSLWHVSAISMQIMLDFYGVPRCFQWMIFQNIYLCNFYRLFFGDFYGMPMGFLLGDFCICNLYGFSTGLRTLCLLLYSRRICMLFLFRNFFGISMAFLFLGDCYEISLHCLCGCF